MGKRTTISILTTYFLPYWLEIVMLFFLILVSNAASLATPYILKEIIDVILPSKDLPRLMQILFTLFSIYVLRILFAFSFDSLYARVSQKVVSDIRSKIMDIVFNKPISFFHEKQTGETLFILSNDVNTVQQFLAYIVNDTINNIILIVGILMIMTGINFNLTLISAASIPVIVVIIFKLSPIIRKKFRVVQEAESVLFNLFTDQLKNIRLIKSYRSKIYENKRIDSSQEEIVKLQVSGARWNSVNKNTVQFIAATVPLIVLGYGGRDVVLGTLTVGGLIAYIQYLNRLLPPITSLVNGYGNALRSIVSMERITKFLGHGDEGINLNPSSSPRLPERISIHFERVSVKIDDKLILNEVGVSFESGKTYFIGGESGSGKSTLLALLSGLVEPSSGNISVSFEGIRCDLSAVSNDLCLVEKDNQIFHDSILNNVDYGIFSRDKSRVTRALECVNLTNRISGLESGVLSRIGSNNTAFSEGQRQRISIARIFMRKYSLILIDEAFSSLDVQNERDILEKIQSFQNDAIIIITSHRESFMDLCDRKFLFQKGHIV